MKINVVLPEPDDLGAAKTRVEDEHGDGPDSLAKEGLLARFREQKPRLVERERPHELLLHARLLHQRDRVLWNQALTRQETEEALERPVVPRHRAGARAVDAHLVQVEPDQMRGDFSCVGDSLRFEEALQKAEAILVPLAGFR